MEKRARGHFERAKGQNFGSSPDVRDPSHQQRMRTPPVIKTTETTKKLSSPVPKPKGPAPTQSNPVKISSKGTGADTKILWAQTLNMSVTDL